MTGTRDAAGQVIGIGPRPNDGTISDPAVLFIGHPAGTGSSGNIPPLVTGHSAHRPKLLVPHQLLQPLMRMIQRIRITVTYRLPLIIPELRKEIFVRLQFDPLLDREIPRALTT